MRPCGPKSPRSVVRVSVSFPASSAGNMVFSTAGVKVLSAVAVLSAQAEPLGQFVITMSYTDNTCSGPGSEALVPRRLGGCIAGVTPNDSLFPTEWEKTALEGSMVVTQYYANSSCTGSTLRASTIEEGNQCVQVSSHEYKKVHIRTFAYFREAAYLGTGNCSTNELVARSDWPLGYCTLVWSGGSSMSVCEGGRVTDLFYKNSLNCTGPSSKQTWAPDTCTLSEFFGFRGTTGSCEGATLFP